MFSLIITIISIALVAALALATLYYGGAAFNKSAATADATKLISQSQQLQGAAELYKADTGAYPVSMADLVAQNYLKSIPVAAAQPEPAALMGSAHAAQPWVMVLSGYPVFALAPITEAVCKSVNLQSYGQAGILRTARKSKLNQCYGTDVNNLIMVTSSNGDMLELVAASPAAVMPLGPVLSDAIPEAASTDTSAAGWLVAPGAAEGAAPQALLYTNDTTGAVLSSFVFPSVRAGSGVEDYLRVKNNSASSITFSATAFTAAAPFGVGYSECDGVTLAPGDSCYFEVYFYPEAVQAYAGASYALSPQGTGAALANLPLSGVGTAGPQALSSPLTVVGTGPVSLYVDGAFIRDYAVYTNVPVLWAYEIRSISGVSSLFPPTAIGQVSGSKLFTVGGGLAPINAYGACVDAECNFPIVSNTCSNTGPSGTCVIEVTFAPKTSGGHSSDLYDIWNGPGLRFAPQAGPFKLRGIGLAPSAGVSASHLTLTPQASIGSSSAPEIVLFTNFSTVAVSASPTILRTSGASELAATTGCTGILAPGASCSATVSYTPASAAGATATLFFNGATVEVTAGVAASLNSVLTLQRGADTLVNYTIDYLASGGALPLNYYAHFVELPTRKGNVVGCGFPIGVVNGLWAVTCTVSAISTLGADTLTIHSYYDGAVSIPINIVQ